MADSNPQNGSADNHHWFDDLLEHPLLWGVLTLIAFAIGFSPKGSDLASVLCLIVAWLLLTRMVYTFRVVKAKHRTQRLKITGLVSVVSLVVIACFGWWLIPKEKEAEPPAPQPNPAPVTRAETPTPEERLHGVLIPANDFVPDNPCIKQVGLAGPRSVISIFLGTVFVYTSNPQTSIKVGDEVIFSFVKEKAGIRISARVISPHNQVVAQITDNEIFINPDDTFRSERPDWHTLIVADRKGNRVLEVRYLNPNMMAVYGHFHANRTPQLIFTPYYTELGSNKFFGRGTYCLGAGKKLVLGAGVTLVAE